ncbi:methyltransferase domain-containing protein [Coleofasciculus sp. FACHB-SPT9]|uniref:class I SAM-dependent methyltransferase n=1 Tax=Cyanophyceae TaxID=3028117 RepID=UPI001684D5AD|nr:methyltransferase domain-containing protein [Coleofasciculus sp. FACHB-SPT9]MBD1890575.1 methyltransferase domain-containing protein [Coleofasciculus sp. FACHB-SPT9]
MDNQSSELLEKIRQQFDAGPYPRIPLEKYPTGETNLLYLHNMVTSYYLRNQKVIDTQDKVILDAGCGTGYKSLMLAAANSGAKVVGIDFSEESIKLAKKRLQYHGFENVEFHVLAIENLQQLNREFNYINCDDVLYLLPDPVTALQAMKSVLKSEGIIRANFHSSLQRTNYYRAQKVFKMMGLMDETPRELEIDIVRETMKALKDQVRLKTFTWDAKREKDEEWFLMNYLFQGDRGYTIPEMFSALKTSDLEFISMVTWREWDLMTLFKEPDNLPVFLAMSLPETTVEDQLHLFELLNPIHRLLDFWCGHPNQAQPFVPVSEWQLSDWQEAIVHLHPQMKTLEVKEELVSRVNQLQPFEISEYLPVMDSTIAACLLPLWESSQSMLSLVQLWQKLRPVNPVTLEPTSEAEAFEIVKQALIGLEDFGCVLLEGQP